MSTLRTRKKTTRPASPCCTGSTAKQSRSQKPQGYCASPIFEQPLLCGIPIVVARGADESPKRFGAEAHGNQTILRETAGPKSPRPRPGRHPDHRPTIGKRRSGCLVKTALTHTRKAPEADT